MWEVWINKKYIGIIETDYEFAVTYWLKKKKVELKPVSIN